MVSSAKPTHCVMIAGASGLVGSHTLDQLLRHAAIDQVIALTRFPLKVQHDKLSEVISPVLDTKDGVKAAITIQLGIIALGTTLKQAGSKSALELVDYTLVCQVAQRMKEAGVTRLAVVSSYGARPDSMSHYLRCKGRAEQTISQMGFEQVIFVRPGPLLGKRKEIRSSELWLQRFMTFGRYLMLGELKNFIPISAKDVAAVMIDGLLNDQHAPVTCLNSQAMRRVLTKTDKSL
ncbi:NAD(P)H-binding protein [Vibrio sp. ABG19]|nr:NAD(P)H-binding protein [Vibrio sp. ABG19]